MKTWEEKLEPSHPCQRCLIEEMVESEVELHGIGQIGQALRADLDRRLSEAGPCTCARPPEMTDQDIQHQESLAELAMFGWS